MCDDVWYVCRKESNCVFFAVILAADEAVLIMRQVIFLRPVHCAAQMKKNREHLYVSWEVVAVSYDKDGFLLIDALCALMIVSLASMLALSIVRLKRIDIHSEWNQKQEETARDLQKMYEALGLYDE